MQLGQQILAFSSSFCNKQQQQQQQQQHAVH
jgi:hypothetical protein